MRNRDFITSVIVPTGIGASLGGFAGDASPAVKLISSISSVIVNPNAVNAACFSGINQNILYTEGYSLDSFFKGEVALRPSKYNKIGVIFDRSIPEKVLNVHLNTLGAVKSVYGIDIMGYKITDEPVGVEFFMDESGISTGNVSNPDTLINAAETLILNGAEAIAVVAYFETPDEDGYAQGQSVDVVGGVEAIISHIISREFHVPVAHAPAFDESSLTIDSDVVDPRAAAEYITPTFLPCILLGLYNAPKPIKACEYVYSDITVKELKALIMPYDALGGLPVIACLNHGTPVIAVNDNKTVLNVTPENLKISGKIIEARNYLEAAGYLLAMREGIPFETLLRG